MRNLHLGIVVLSMMVVPAGAGPLDPLACSSLGELPNGDVIFNTTGTPTVNGSPAGVVVPQTGGPDIAVFCFDGEAVLGQADTITVTGARPAAILFQGQATLHGEIIVSAGGGPGGTQMSSGTGPGAGLGSSQGGGGGGFGAGGGAGGGISGGAGGISYGSGELTPLHAGSGGGGGEAAGGTGGGAIEIGSLALLVANGEIHADGWSGAFHLTEGGGGGGSGGGVFLHAFDVYIGDAVITANGGDGGNGGFGGGGGGAGRIVLMSNDGGAVTMAPEAVFLLNGGNGGVGAANGQNGLAASLMQATDPGVGLDGPGEPVIFADGFESGDTIAWSGSVGFPMAYVNWYVDSMHRSGN
jgi:hypothetical protein